MIATVEQQVEALARLDLNGLRALWRKRWGDLPALRSVQILTQVIAFRIQVEAYGGLDAQTQRQLARKGTVRAEGLHLGIGAQLTRRWQGRQVTVEVTPEGFAWAGQRFKSLSAAATAIAGSRWNGPRFFGLRSDS